MTDDKITFDRSAAKFMLEVFGMENPACEYCKQKITTENLCGFRKFDFVVIFCNSLMCMIKHVENETQYVRRERLLKKFNEVNPMLKTREGKEIVCLRHEDKNGVKPVEVLRLLEKEGLRCLGVEEMMDCDNVTIDAIYEECRRFYMITKYGLLVRNGYYDYRRDVYADFGPSLRLGVVGVRDTPHVHQFEDQPKKCNCGKEGKA